MASFCAKEHAYSRRFGLYNYQKLGVKNDRGAAGCRRRGRLRADILAGIEILIIVGLQLPKAAVRRPVRIFIESIAAKSRLKSNPDLAYNGLKAAKTIDGTRSNFSY